MKKILYLVTEDWYFWSHRRGLAEAARQQGHEIHVLTRSGALTEKITGSGFKLHPLSMARSIGSPFRELGMLLTLYKYYRDIKPDLVHQIALKPVLVGSIAAWCARVPAVINSYTGLGNLFISESFKTRVIRSMLVPVLRILLRSPRFHSIVQNPDDTELLVRLRLVDSKRMSLIRGSGVDTGVFAYSEELSDSPVIVMFASRLLKDKGIYEFIDAARLIHKKNLDVRFIVVGDRDEASPTSIRQQDLSGWVETGIIEWWGYREDMEKVFSHANLVCLPSYREGLPKVLLEAASCGRAIVTTDVPGCREVVEHGVNGLLVPARDPALLAEAIERLAMAPDLRHKMGLAGRDRVIKYFDLQRVTKETLNLYNVLIKDP